MPFDPDAYINQKMGAKPFDPDAYIAQKMDQPQSTSSKVLQAVVAAAKKADSYTGAPMRAGIAAAQNAGSMDPRDWAKVGAEAFGKQFGENPDQAPTGEDIVKRAGVPEGMASKAAGFGMDIAANPLNFTGPIAAGASKVVNAAKEVPVAAAVINSPKNLVAKALSTVTTPSAEAWEAYATKTKQVNDLISKHGGEIAPMADELKSTIMSDISNLKQGLSNDIEGALQKSAAMDADSPGISSRPIIDALNRAKVKLHPLTQSDEINEIDNHIKMIEQLAPDGQMSLGNLNAAKNYLQEWGYPAVRKGNQIFTPSTAAQSAAKQASGVANEILRKDAPPELAHANDVYSQLHDIQDKVGNLFKEGNAATQLVAAGGGKGTPSQTILRELGGLTGKDYLNNANTLYAAKAMNNPNMRTSVVRALLTTGNAAANSQIPARLYNASQFLGSPSISGSTTDAIDRRIQRRLGSQ